MWLLILGWALGLNSWSVSSEVDLTLLQIKNSRDYLQYSQNSHTRENLSSFLTEAPDSFYCSDFEKLSDSDLGLLESLLLSSKKLSQCKDNLERRLAQFWAKTQEQLPAVSWMVGGSLKTLEIEVDTEKDYGPPELQDHQVVLTFDDGPLNTTSEILNILNTYQTRAMFFTVGKMVKNFPEMIQREVMEYHTVGSHSFTHQYKLSEMDSEIAWQTEIRLGFKALFRISKNLGGVDPFFRPPWGSITRDQSAWLHQQKIVKVMWTVDSLDYKNTDPRIVLNNIIHQVETKNRGYILMHDIHRVTVLMLPHLLNYLQSNHYKVVVLIPKNPITRLQNNLYY